MYIYNNINISIMGTKVEGIIYIKLLSESISTNGIGEWRDFDL